MSAKPESPIINLVLRRMTALGVSRKDLADLLVYGRNPTKVFRRIDELIRGERFVPDFIKRVAETLRIPAEQLAVAWEAHDSIEQKLRTESEIRAIEKTMGERGPHLWGCLPDNYHPSLISVLGAEFFLLVRLPEEISRLPHYELTMEVGRMVRDHYLKERRCRLIGYELRLSLDCAYQFDVEGECLGRVKGSSLCSRTMVRVGTQAVDTPSKLLWGRPE